MIDSSGEYSDDSSWASYMQSARRIWRRGKKVVADGRRCQMLFPFRSWCVPAKKKSTEKCTLVLIKISWLAWLLLTRYPDWKFGPNESVVKLTRQGHTCYMTRRSRSDENLKSHCQLGVEADVSWSIQSKPRAVELLPHIAAPTIEVTCVPTVDIFVRGLSALWGSDHMRVFTDRYPRA